jgi:iron complex transport system permease protein
MAGAALASSGAAYQGLFRNPLADPYLLGVASGAGLGAVLAMTIHWPGNIFGLYTVPAAAFVFSLGMVLIVYSISRVGGNTPTTTLILAGVACGSFATALTSFLMLRSTGELHRTISWLLGGGLLAGWEPIIAMSPYLMIGIACLVLSGYSLNVLQFGDEQAQQMGLPVQQRKMIIVLAASLTTAAAVAFAGIIGFIGLIVPHVVRLLWGSDYRRVILLSILGGSSALLLADLLARVVMAPQVLPVGIVTALAGAPFFLWLLRRSRSTGI